MFAGVTIGAVVIGGFLIVASAMAGGELTGSLRSGRYRRALGWLLLIPVVLAVVGLMGWGLAANTVFRYQTAEVTASRTMGELTVEQRRPLGGGAARTWNYDDIAVIEFDYIPASGGENPTPPQGVVYVGGSDGSRSQIYAGSACVARDLADAITSATSVPIRVHSGGRDIASYGSFLTQIRCGVQEPFRPTSWREYPAEAWRVLDLPFLWRWPWALPVVLGQLVLIAAALIVISRWRAGAVPRIAMVAVLIVAGLGVAALHIVAATSYGSWPAALALFALFSGKFVAGRLQRTDRPRAGETSGERQAGGQ
jgi:hypothetical protein